MDQVFEVEIRGLISEEIFRLTLDRFQKDGVKIEQDDRETVFFMINGATLKVVNMISKKKAKIAFKSGDIVRTIGQKEIEIDISGNHFKEAISLFESLGFTDIQYTKQTRYNINLENVEIALKWSKDWSFHFEAEYIVNKEEDIEPARKKLVELCEKYNLKPMTEDEMEELRTAVDAHHANLSKS